MTADTTGLRLRLADCRQALHDAKTTADLSYEAERAFELMGEAIDALAKPTHAGWRMVPIEPTEAMLKAGVGEWLGRGAPVFSAGWQAYVLKTWRAMLGATPTTSETSSVEGR